VSIAIIRFCDSVCLCVSVRTIKPKQLKLKSWHRGSPSRYLAHQLQGQRSQGQKVQKKRLSGSRDLCTTLCFKKLYHFYFCNNFFIRVPIFIIFGSNMPEEICNKSTKRILHFPPHLIYVLLLYLVTRAASLTNVHSCHSEFLRTPFLQTF